MGLEVQFSPGNLAGIGGEGTDEIGSRGTLEEVHGMELAHSAQSGHADLKLLDGHCDVVLSEEGKKRNGC